MGLSYFFAIDHSGVAHTLDSSRWGEAAFAIKQRGAVWNLRKRQLPPCPWAGDQTMWKPASDTQHLPLAPWCKPHANPPLTCICQPREREGGLSYVCTLTLELHCACYATAVEVLLRKIFAKVDCECGSEGWKWKWLFFFRFFHAIALSKQMGLT